MKSYNAEKEYSKTLKLSGNQFSFSAYNEEIGAFEYSTQFKESNGYISAGNFAVRTKKIVGCKFFDEVDFDEMEETIYTIYRQERAEDDHDSPTTYIKNILGKRTIVEYKKKKKLHRLSGPAVEDTGFYYDNCIFNSLPVNLYIYNGVMLPEWLPKINNGKVDVEVTKAMLVKISLLYDSNYAKTIELVYGSKQKNL